MAERKWTKEQQDAIDARQGTLLVSAAAGSGKTAVLVQRIIDRITDPHTPGSIDRLLVVTFTRAAAAEMRERIARRLAELLHHDPENAQLKRQQLLLPQARISTTTVRIAVPRLDSTFWIPSFPKMEVAAAKMAESPA